MGKQRKDPRKKQQEEAQDPAEMAGEADFDIAGVVDYDRFLETLDDSSDSDEEDEEADPAQEGDSGDDDDDDDDDEDDDNDEQEMEPEEEQDLNEDEDEEDTDSNDQESSDDQGIEEEGEEDIPIQNGFAGGEGDSTDESDNERPKDEGLTAKKHKMDLEKLQDTDPEFFAYLKENDAELLNFDGSDADTDSDEEEALHKPPETLEEASDSEAEEERLDDTSDEHKSTVQKLLHKRIVDMNVISHWEKQISETRDLTVLSNVIDALQCAVNVLAQGDTGGEMKWRVDGSANFNALLRLCIKEMKGFCVRFLYGNNNVALNENKFDQRPFDAVKDRSKQKWGRLRPKVKSYMEIMVQLFKCMGNPDAVASLLRHCLRMCGFWALLTAKSFKMLRSMVNIWSQGEDSCRVLAFLIIIRMANYSKDVFLLQMFKQMYISYVANCKFTSVNTWPAINFMRSSLVELYLLDTELAYSVAFPFIRQLAIHLRNALSPGSVQIDKKKKESETFRVVYSWQFVHSLHLWVDVLAQAGANEDENLKLLVYPVVQLCMGTVKLIPTKRFIPIRFHIVRMLIKLQEKTGVFIPVLPLIKEVLQLTNFSDKSATKFSVRPIDLTCCLKADSTESGYLKAVADNVFETILLYCKAVGTEVGYPEIVSPTVIYLRRFVKKDCKNLEVSKKFKTLLEKIDANSKYVNERRNKALEDGSVNLADKKSIKILQVQMQTTKPHPPIIAYANEYFKLNQKAQAKASRPTLETKEERLIPKPHALNSKKSQDRSQDDSIDFGKAMFESDSENGDDEFHTKLEEDTQTKSTKQSKKKQKRKMQSEDDPESDSEVNGIPSETDKIKKKRKGKLNKSKKARHENQKFEEFQDQLVDFELSD